MKRLVLAAVCAALLMWPAVAQAATPFTYHDDPVTGKVVALNDVLKLVWGYRSLRSESDIRSGGSLYGLWDKASDPRSQRNLVQTLPASGSISGHSTPSRAGVGGFGATKAYVKGSSVAISEVGLRGTLLDHSVRTDAAGNLRVAFTFEVADPKLTPTYRVTKEWTVTSSGVIGLHVSWVWLTSMATNDPCYNFAVSRDRGWQRVGWYSHSWMACDGVDSDGLDNHNSWTYDRSLAREGDSDYPTYHAQKVSFEGSPSARRLTIAVGAGRGGYESSGLFHLGYTTWRAVFAPYMQLTGEFSNYRTAAYGHEVRWGAWYSDDGGQLTPPNMPSRFRWITAGTSWDDYFTIRLGS